MSMPHLACIHSTRWHPCALRLHQRRPISQLRDAPPGDTHRKQGSGEAAQSPMLHEVHDGFAFPVQAATSAPLIERSIERATGIVYNITGGRDLTLQEVRTPLCLDTQCCTLVLIGHCCSGIAAAGLHLHCTGLRRVACECDSCVKHPDCMAAASVVFTRAV